MNPGTVGGGAFSVWCWRCGGTGCKPKHVARQRHKCVTGRVWFKRCPRFYWSPWVSDFMQTYRAFDEHGVMPADGGLYSQDAKWWQAVRFARVVELGHKRRAREKAEREAARRRSR